MFGRLLTRESWLPPEGSNTEAKALRKTRSSFIQSANDHSVFNMDQGLLYKLGSYK